ncbi:hypothetical protein [Planctomicrobium sp. SH527]|uniref:hypothetical protein n=1 Tax=Planctomicrobium sp. SH527 TaxID=3448123 RepID=UPI003F5BE94E
MKNAAAEVGLMIPLDSGEWVASTMDRPGRLLSKGNRNFPLLHAYLLWFIRPDLKLFVASIFHQK